MKKTFTYLLCVAAVSLSAIACHDFKDDYMVDDSVYLRSDDGNVQEFSIYDATNRFGVIKAGKGFSPAYVTLGVSNAELEKFNSANGTEYIPLAKSFYNYDEINGRTVNFDASDARVKVDLTWNPTMMVALLDGSADQYVIPIVAQESNLSITEGKKLLIVKPVMSTLSVKAGDTGLLGVPAGVTSSVYGKLAVQLDNAIPSRDVKVTLAMDNSLVAGYVYNGISYTQATGDMVQLESEEVTIKAGDNEADIRLVVNLKGVADDVKYIAAAVKVVKSDIDQMPIAGDVIIVRLQKTAAQ